MLFVSRYANHSIVIRNGLYRRSENEAGQMYSEPIRPDLLVDFIPRRMTEAQRIIAVRMFKQINPEAPFGAVPYETDGTMGQEFGDLIMDVERYSGYNPAFSLSKYDTRTDVPYEAQLAVSDVEKAELKKLIEDVLMSMATFGQDFIRLDEALPKPWPAYPLEATPGVAKKIVSLARDFGVPWQDILDFEKTQDKPRENVIAEVEVEVAKAAAAEAERAALGAIIA